MALSKNERELLQLLKAIKQAGTDQEKRRAAITSLNERFSANYQRVLKSDIKRKCRILKDDLALYEETARLLDEYI